jgi:hypothetical protein
MKFSGNNFFGSRVFQKKLKNFHQVLAEQERVLVKMVKMYVNFQNHVKSPISIGLSKI